MRPLRDVGRNSIIILVIALATAFLIAAASDLAEMESGGTLTYSWLNSLREAVVNIEEVSGIVKMDGAGTPSAATAGTDYQSPTTTPITQWYTATDYTTKVASPSAINIMVYNKGVIYECIVAHTSGDTDDEPGTGATWQTYWQAGGSGFDAANPGAIGGTTPATNIKADIIEMTRNATAGDGWRFREGSNNGDNYTIVKGRDNQDSTTTLTLPNRDGLVGPPAVVSSKAADFNAYDDDGEWTVIPFTGADTQINLEDVTSLSNGSLIVLSHDANDKYIAPAANDKIYYTNTGTWTALDDGDKLLVTDVGPVWLFRAQDQTGWFAHSYLTLADGGVGGLSGWNSGIIGDADCLGYYLMESGALTTDSSGETNTLTSSGSPAASTGSQWTDYVEGSGAIDYEHDTNDYMYIAGSADNYGVASSNEFSITAWVKLESSETDRGYIMIKAATNKKMLILGLNSTGKAFFNYDEDDDDTWDGPTAHGSTTTDGQWYFVAFTWDGTDSGAYRLHVYGHTEGTTIGSDLTGTVTLTNLNQDATWVWGGQAGYSVDGLMDEVTVWDRALTTTDIDQIRAGTYGQ